MELATGVYAFPQTIERDGMETTIHPAAVETPKGLVLLDVGYPGLLDQVEANLHETGNDWDDVRAVLVTHQDGDHAGALGEVVGRTDAVVYAHEQCAPYVDGRRHPIKSPEGERYQPAEIDVELVDGVSFRTAAGPMDVVFTPGHAPGHVSLHFPDAELLVTADALTADESGLAGPSDEFTLDMEAALDSAAALVDRSFADTLCYHGGHVAASDEDLDDVVEQLR